MDTNAVRKVLASIAAAQTVVGPGAHLLPGRMPVVPPIRVLPALAGPAMLARAADQLVSVRTAGRDHVPAVQAATAARVPAAAIAARVVTAKLDCSIEIHE